jgi:hypothetical protein
MKRDFGILAFGSLIDDPGDEIAAVTVEILQDGIVTPFPVEFARSSRNRAGAPTLVPVSSGGACIAARIFVLQAGLSEQEGRDMLWRRETRRNDQEQNSLPRSNPGGGEISIRSLTGFHGVGLVLHTWAAANIAPLTPQRLAELALNSARRADVAANGRDGISYLIAALRNGIRTQLSGAYEEEVLRQAGAATLAEARQQMLSSPRQ